MSIPSTKLQVMSSPIPATVDVNTGKLNNYCPNIYFNGTRHIHAILSYTKRVLLRTTILAGFALALPK